MIRVSLTQIILVYLILILTILFGIWLGMDYFRKRRARTAKKHKIHCTICGVIYEDTSENPLPQCPNCQSVNERMKIQDI